MLGGAGWWQGAGDRTQEEALGEQVGRVLCHQPPMVSVVGRAIILSPSVSFSGHYTSDSNQSVGLIPRFTHQEKGPQRNIQRGYQAQGSWGLWGTLCLTHNRWACLSSGTGMKLSHSWDLSRDLTVLSHALRYLLVSSDLKQSGVARARGSSGGCL